MQNTLFGILLVYMFFLVFLPKAFGRSCGELYAKFLQGWHEGRKKIEETPQ